MLGLDHPDIAYSYMAIGITYSQMGEYYKSLDYLENAVGILEKKLGHDHPDTIATQKKIVDVKDKMGQQ